MKKTVWLLVVLMVACGGEDSGVGKATETLCSIAEQTDGSKLITCDDGTSAVLRDGVDGLAGRDGVDGMDGAPGPVGPAGVVPSVCPNGAVSGSYTIENLASVANLAACRIITGDLEIKTVGFQKVSLPDLVTVQGRLIIEGSDSRNGDLTVLELPALARVGTLNVLYTSLRELELPELQQVEYVLVAANPGLAAIDAPKLTTVRVTLQIAVNNRLTAISMPALSDGFGLNSTGGGGQFNVFSNALLPACQAQALLNQLSVVPVASNTTGNLGTCP